jgi:hypothetical protein
MFYLTLSVGFTDISPVKGEKSVKVKTRQVFAFF